MVGRMKLMCFWFAGLVVTSWSFNVVAPERSGGGSGGSGGGLRRGALPFGVVASGAEGGRLGGGGGGGRALTSSGTWSEFRGGPYRDGVTDQIGPAGNGTSWRFLLRGASMAPPTVHPDGSMVYVGAGVQRP